jgi:NitT/TauT family transport system permease protein
MDPKGIPVKKNIHWRLGLGSIVFWIAIWQTIAFAADSPVVPYPFAVLGRVVELMQTKDAIVDVATSMLRVSMGVFLAFAIGLSIGIAVYFQASLSWIFRILTWILSATPSYIWSVLAIIWFGISDYGKIFVVTCLATPQIAIGLLEGTNIGRSNLREMLEHFEVPTRTIITKFVLPSVVTHLYSSIGNSVGTSWRVLILAEALGGSTGVGYRIAEAADRLRINDLFAWAVLAILASILLQIATRKIIEVFIGNGKNLRLSESDC